MDGIRFRNLTEELATRIGRAAVSQLGPRTPALAEVLRERLTSWIGEDGSLVAPPVFETLFEWERSGISLADLEGRLLPPSLVSALAEPPEALAKYCFPRTRQPYRHQLAAWQTLLDERPRSVVVSTGTASGKTECFLVPVLADLAGELARGAVGPLVGVRALFLYPLNALINSQRERLAAYAHGFDGALRFALYNGNTRERRPPRWASDPCELRSRSEIRATPPPILLTNATMLEYMLVRFADVPIVDASRGLLRWIVLDEAHTYVGSRAAELTLLLRRVLLAFGVNATQVRFVATSATIGDRSGTEALQRYLADVSGTAPEQVVVVTGARRVPDLLGRGVDAEIPSAAELAALAPASRFTRLARSRPMRTLRDALGRGAMTIDEIAGHLGTSDGSRELLGVLDEASRAAPAEGPTFLPLRGHLFIRALGGLWACSSPSCPGRGQLGDSEWSFGRLFFGHRVTCEDDCRAAVFPVVFCNACGQHYLLAREDGTQGVLHAAAPSELGLDTDEPVELSDDNDDEGVAAPAGPLRLLCGPWAPAGRASSAVPYNPLTARLGSEPAPASVRFAARKGGRPACARCGERQRPDDDLFRTLRLGAPFFLGVAIPTVLEAIPVDPDGAHAPDRGRQLITFSDSRQGTARFAARSQIESERTYVRGLLYHGLWSEALRRASQVSPGRTTDLEAQIGRLRAAGPGLEDVIREREVELARAREAIAAPPGASMPWQQAEARLAQEPTIERMLAGQKRRYLATQLRAASFASLCMLREFARRPRRQSSLETLGLVALEYPSLARITSAPRPWLQQRSLEEWRAFLACALDYFVRAHTAIVIDEDVLRWLGTSIRRTLLVPPGEPAGPRAYAFPLGTFRRSRLPRYALTAMGLDPASDEDWRLVPPVMHHAWDDLSRSVLTQTAGGRILDLAAQAHLRTVPEAWLCPITRRLLATTVGGISPYQVVSDDQRHMPSLRVTMPRPPAVFANDPAATAVWIAMDPLVAEARRVGAWPEHSDRIASPPRYFVVAEHSAQQSRTRLDQLEKDFRGKQINVLSCSTTMEMGVDIGDLSGVGMNNAPPSPASYLQRAGRSGRRGQAQAAVVTLCQAQPHGEAVFRNPRWAFDTPIHVPRVSLDSERIVERHLHSYLLAEFLRGHAQDHHRLECAWFFLEADGAPSRARRFSGWLLDEASASKPIDHGIAAITRLTALATADRRRLCERASARIDEINAAWLGEHDAVYEQLVRLGGDPDGRGGEPEQLALSFQLRRMRQEYLLAQLATSGFLPAYGFPLGVLPFINTTAELLEAERRRVDEDGDGAAGREEPAGHRRGYPTRQLPVAIREYAPGSAVILDGVVYESGGVSLHWKRPPTDQAVREIVALRWASRCRGCGAIREESQPREACACGQPVEVRRFLRPSGFAVDIRARPTNDLARQKFIPVCEPWISAGGGAWRPLTNPAVGRVRHDQAGLIFHHSRGEAGHGYAICLACGRASSETGEDQELPIAAPHDQLRGGSRRARTSECRAGSDGHSIQRHLVLGGFERTDVVELELVDPRTGAPVRDRTACVTLAVALRQAIAESLGLDVREIGWAAPRVASGRGSAHSIVLYDAADGGAGYVEAFARDVRGNLASARAILDCPRHCDGACHGCLLAFDTQESVEYLNRCAALAILSDELFAALELPAPLRVLGETTEIELSTVTSALREALRAGGVKRVRIQLGGDPANWVIDDWSLTRHMLQWAADGIPVELIIPESAAASLPWDEANRLASWGDAGRIALVIAPHAGWTLGDHLVLAEVEARHVRTVWVATDLALGEPGEAWGRGDERRFVLRGPALEPAPALRAPRPDELRKPRPGQWLGLVLGDELDGPTQSLGARFWRLARERFPGLAARLKAAPPLAHVVYTDRYLNSPADARLLYELLRTLVNPGGIDPDVTRLTLKTYGCSNERHPVRLYHNFPDDLGKREVLTHLLGRLTRLCSVRIEARGAAMHDRVLLLHWADGKQFLVKLGQGLGHLNVVGNVPHRFDDPIDDQIAAILRVTAPVERRDCTPVTAELSGIVEGHELAKALLV